MSMRNKTMIALLIGLFTAAVLGGAAIILQPLPLGPSSQSPAATGEADQQKEVQAQIEAYQSLLAEDPNNPKYHQGLANLYWGIGEWEKAAEHFQQALALNPEDDELRLMTAMAHWHAGKIEEAIGLLQTAIERNPDDPMPQFYLGMLLANQEGREEEAIAALERAIALSSDSEPALQARRMLVQLRGEGVPPRSSSTAGSSPRSSPASAPSTTAEAARLFPESLGGLTLQEAYGGARAKREIEQMHKGKITIERGFVAFYSDAGGERSATFWLSEAQDEQEALDLVGQMEQGIAQGGTPFAPLETLRIPGLEAIPVYATQGMGQFHYIWVKKRWIVWVALDEPDPEKRLEFLKAAIVFIG